ncbi:carbonic anhydrase [Haloimpatiens sp. FM7330]|uniref:carbonic anhydrase n=1 Tax=Haloimpatiens sp. FM7330 TaxID=3298610 RepID=UPI00363F247B
MSNRFVTAINCMDGRVQEPVIEYLKKNYRIDYVDMITEPGPNKILAENKDKCIIDSIKKRIDISLDKHKSNLIAVVGHYDCAGNPKSKQGQIEDIKIALKNVRSWYNDVMLIGLWVDEKWKVSEVCKSY